VGSGLLGAFNSNRAETAVGVVADRYLVLQPPVREMRASVASFQVVAEQGFSGSGVTPALLAGAVADSTATDQAYLTLSHMLALPANRSLAPHLDAAERAYVASRTGLAAFLTVGAKTPEATKMAANERLADQNLDGALGGLQNTITDRLIQTSDQARSAARNARNDLIWCLALGLPFGILITTLMARKSLRVERADAERDRAQAMINQRIDFEGRLQQALEMARAETPAFDMVAQALGEAAPAMHSELLLADSSRAHFRQVLALSSDGGEAGCGVVSPVECPAASSGQTKVFALSTSLGACPNLRGRGCSALCVPVSIAGNSAGVIHVTSVDGTPPSDVVRRNVEVVARRASERFAMLRAFEVSQTQANTDSLTGLLTRRSLENSIYDLSTSGVPYSVAYGDLDHFKQLNDVFGHSAGDRALRAFAQVLRDDLRPSDIACRYGGEEFVIVLPACPVNEAVIVLERIRQQLSNRLSLGRLPTFTVSFGLCSSEQGADFERVVNMADEALLQAKAAGRDRIVIAGDDPGDAAPSTDDPRPTPSGAHGAPLDREESAPPLVVPLSWSP
jgi:diguanylate cyclase (GGDEF)-like protein